MPDLPTTYRADGLEPLEPRVLFNGDLSILPLGDSITASSSSYLSYRYYLWTQLVADGTAFDFIGTEDTNRGSTPNWPDFAGQQFDRDHEGHSGRRVDQINQTLPGWLNGYTPDIALVHLGTNDLLQGQSASSTADELRTTIALLRQDNPDVTIFLAQILPIEPVSASTIDDYNNRVANLASELSTAQSRIIVVDQHTGFSINHHLRDGIHPNTAGEQQMADRFYDALADFLDQTPAPPPAPTPNVVPNAHAGPDQTRTDTNGDGQASIALNGTASNDPDGSLVSYTWRLNGSTIATGASPSVNLGLGTHTITLTVTDDDGASDNDTVRITLNAQPTPPTPNPPSNNAPVVNAGPDRTYVTSNGRVTLAGSASDDGAFTAGWSVVSAPGTVSFANAASPTSQVTLTGYGTYTLRLTATDGTNTTTDDVRLTISPPNSTPSPPPTPTPPSNSAPVVNAGPDRTYVTSNGRVTLAGSATDDGALITGWSIVSAPGGVAFANAASPTSQVTLTGYGTYTLRLTANDGTTSRSDDVRLTISAPGSAPAPTPTPPSNSAPVVNAGPDRTYYTNNGRLSLLGSATDDGALTTWWSIVSAPGGVAFDNINSPTSQVTISGTGTYILRLNASDGSTTVSDEVRLTIYRPS